MSGLAKISSSVRGYSKLLFSKTLESRFVAISSATLPRTKAVKMSPIINTKLTHDSLIRLKRNVKNFKAKGVSWNKTPA